MDATLVTFGSAAPPLTCCDWGSCGDVCSAEAGDTIASTGTSSSSAAARARLAAGLESATASSRRLPVRGKRRESVGEVAVPADRDTAANASPAAFTASTCTLGCSDDVASTPASFFFERKTTAAVDTGEDVLLCVGVIGAAAVAAAPVGDATLGHGAPLAAATAAVDDTGGGGSGEAGGCDDVDVPPRSASV